MMRLMLCAVLLQLAGCSFDDKRSKDLRYPATLTVINRAEVAIRIQSIYSPPEVQQAFILNGFNLAPGKSADMAISEPALDSIKAARVLIDVYCGADTGTGPTLAADDLIIKPGAEASAVAIEISSCAPHNPGRTAPTP